MLPSRIKERLRAEITRGLLRRPAAIAYELVIAQELAAVRALDAFATNDGERGAERLDDVTAVIKTFERPYALRRLLASIRRRFPSLRVVVVDDSKSPTVMDGVETVLMPFDTGVSAGKRAGLARVTTKYVLMLDDDFVFYRRTRLPDAVRVLDTQREIDLVGGDVVNLPFFTRVDYETAELFPTAAAPTFRKGTSIAGLPVYDKVPNFYVARTEKLRLVGWTPELKRVDHADFFTRAKGVLTTVFYADFKCLHAQTPFDREYMRHRGDCDSDFETLRRRWNPNA